MKKAEKTKNHDRHEGHVLSIPSLASQIRAELDKNALLTAKNLCKILGLDYKKKAGYVTKVKHLWKYDLKNRLGLNSGIFKNWQGWIYAPPSIDVDRAVEAGWIQTKSKNKYLLWKSKLGRLEWHPKSRRIRIGIKKPASKGRVNQLFVNAFLRTGLIYDYSFFEAFIRSVRFKRSTFIIKTSGRIPYFKVDFLKDSNGVMIKGGDRSHPDCIEITFFYPDWGEKAEAVIAKLNHTLEQLFDSKSRKPRDNRIGGVV